MGSCKFQFWVDRIESFYCNLEGCSWDSRDSFGELPTDHSLGFSLDSHAVALSGVSAEQVKVT
jgi:hypothetical protein